MVMGSSIQIPYGLKPVVIYDLDSTIANTKHRHHFIDKIMAGEGTWEEYSLMCEQDTIFPGVLRLAQVTSQMFQNFILTARMAVARPQTETWLRTVQFPYSLLKMCEDDHDDHVGWKRKAVAEWRANGFEPILAVEDSPEVMDAFEADGIRCLAVNPRYHDDKPEGFF